MGRVITTNSATLVNKGLELLEAHLLYGVPLDRIDVVVHPQSLVHSMVQFVDGSTLAQCSPPDMRLPIALGAGLAGPGARAAAACDWSRAQEWTFEPLDDEAFPAVELARTAGRHGGQRARGLQRGERGLRGRLPRGPALLPRHRRRRRRAVLGEHVASLGSGPGRRRLDAGRRRRPHARGGARGRRLGPGACRELVAQGTSGRSEEVTSDLMDIVVYVLGAVVFFALVMASIALHEIGHLVPGKIFGVKTTQYFVGFGKTLWSTRRGRDRVRRQGGAAGRLRPLRRHVPAEQASTRARSADAHRALPDMADQARSVEWEDIRPEDEGRLFYQKRAWQKIDHHGRRARP